MTIEVSKQTFYAVIPTVQRPIIQKDPWERRALAAECALIEAQDAIRCSCDLLRENAPGPALEVLEAQLKK